MHFLNTDIVLNETNIRYSTNSNREGSTVDTRRATRHIFERGFYGTQLNANLDPIDLDFNYTNNPSTNQVLGMSQNTLFRLSNFSNVIMPVLSRSVWSMVAIARAIHNDANYQIPSYMFEKNFITKPGVSIFYDPINFLSRRPPSSFRERMPWVDAVVNGPNNYIDHVYINIRANQFINTITDRVYTNTLNPLVMVFSISKDSDIFALFLTGVTGASVQFESIDSSNVVISNKTLNVPSSNLVSFTNQKVRNGGYVRISITRNSSNEIGFESLLSGSLFEIGETRKPANYSYISYQDVNYNESSGETSISPGSSIDRGQFVIQQRNKGTAYEVREILADLQTGSNPQPTLWMPDIDNTNTWMRAYRREFTMDITEDDYALFDLTVLGLLGAI